MQANSANLRAPLPVSVIVYDNVKLLDVTGPLQVFSDARSSDGSAAYRISIVSADGEPVTTDTVLPLTPMHPADAPPADTLIVAGGRGALEARYSPGLMAL